MAAVKNWQHLGKLYLFFLFFSLPYQVAIYSTGMSNSVGMREAILRSTLWLIPVLLLPRYTKKITAVIGIVLWATSVVCWSYFYVFQQDFSQSVLFIIFESNPAESKEFIESYIRYEIVGLIILYALLAILFWRQIVPVALPRLSKTITISLLSLLVSWPFINPLLIQGKPLDSAIKKLEDRFEPVAPWNIVVGFMKYKAVLSTMQARLAQNSSIPPLVELTDSNPNEQPTMVLVIGESTNSNRMSLYGYARKTTPLLDSIRDELYIFNNVISPRPYTIEALEQILSFGDQQNPDAYLSQPTLMNIMEQAGYTSYWITNQQTQTKRNTMLLTFSQQMDQQVYLNNNRKQDAKQFDEAVIQPFKDALNDKAQRKFIIIHLLGTHRAYHYRYPENYNFFTTSDGTPDWLSDDELEEYNQYDNAVLYNDYVISSLIDTLKKDNGNSALVYFSDHGEEVYDTKGLRFSGRNEGKPTPAMYTVPFIAWLSPTWAQQKESSDLKAYTSRAYLNSDFIYSWVDLANIDFQSNKPSHSLFNPLFSERPRMIGDPNNPRSLINFDDHFPSSNNQKHTTREL